MNSIQKHKIDQGLWLEKEKTLIPWGTTKNELHKIGNPEMPSDLSYHWKDQHVFGIEGINISVTFDQYENKDTVKFFRFMQTNGNVNDAYNSIKAHLLQNFGEPVSDKKDDYNYPNTIWSLNDFEIVLGIAERFIEYLVFVLRIKSA